ncbi:MAG TPA: ABC-F family ATP-binding cassette domain-containing protein [Thermoanaerobaculia bacterium]|nr:ABC-F family ATP-binding cassette domain-containing protein [Thermoanaerobaculia bacterium]
MPPTPLLSADHLSKSFGAKPLFEDLSFTLFEGDHAGLIGPNGSGKSTLLRILAGADEPDSGSVVCRRALRVGYVPQDPVFAPGRTVGEVVIDALAGDAFLDPHEREPRASVALGKAGFEDIDQLTDVLSGGWRKRLAIALEIARQPDVLLLDEPTNHLDVEGILWLEALLKTEPEAFIVVSHDRWFLENVTRRMLELSRVYPEGLFETSGTYSEFLEKRDELLRNEAAYRDTLANLVRREMEWLRRGPKARTTKSKARIQSAGKLIDELEESRARAAVASAGIDFTASERQTKRLWTAKGLTKRFAGRAIVRDLDLLLTAGTRLGILGPNGSGKTTLLRLIVGELDPDAGTITRADRLRIVYFEQNRETLDPALTLRRALSPEGDTVVWGDRGLHVASWAKRFLFRPDQLDTQVARLSGGEKARIVLARLMLKPADLLVLDEPTNDLDIPTLDVLEESLLEFPGALVLVTHDRFLLGRVSTSLLALDGEGGAERYADLAQWETESASAEARRGGLRPPGPSDREKPRAKRLSYRDQREFDAMEETLLVAEARLETARERAHDPAVASDAEELQRRFTELNAVQAEVDRLYARWAELEAKRG